MMPRPLSAPAMTRSWKKPSARLIRARKSCTPDGYTPTLRSGFVFCTAECPALDPDYFGDRDRRGGGDCAGQLRAELPKLCRKPVPRDRREYLICWLDQSKWAQCQLD